MGRIKKPAGEYSIIEFKNFVKLLPFKKKRSHNSFEKQAFYHIMRSLPYGGLVEEHPFCPGRKFRADFAFPAHKLLIEYEGVWGKGRSRHTTPVGYTKDTEKYNAAARLGYRVLRYTALNFRAVVNDLSDILGSK